MTTMASPVKYLPLSERALNALENGGLSECSVGGLDSLLSTDDGLRQVLRIKNLGRKTLNEIRDAISDVKTGGPRIDAVAFEKMIAEFQQLKSLFREHIEASDRLTRAEFASVRLALEQERDKFLGATRDYIVAAVRSARQDLVREVSIEAKMRELGQSQ